MWSTFKSLFCYEFTDYSLEVLYKNQFILNLLSLWCQTLKLTWASYFQDISDSIDDFGGIKPHMFLCLLAAWTVVYLVNCAYFLSQSTFSLKSFWLTWKFLETSRKTSIFKFFFVHFLDCYEGHSVIWVRGLLHSLVSVCRPYHLLFPRYYSQGCLGWIGAYVLPQNGKFTQTNCVAWCSKPGIINIYTTVY